MDDIDVNKYCGKFEYVSFDDLIPKGDFARFVVLIVDSLLKTFNLENELFLSAKDNKKVYSINKNVIISILWLFKRIYQS